MSNNGKNIFQALHQDKWLYIEYRNKKQEITKYWIAIKNINLAKKTLAVEGLHLGQLSIARFNIAIDGIISSAVIEGSYQKTNKKLISEIQDNDHLYQSLFGSVANLKILGYLEDCNRMDVAPYCKDFALIRHIDADSFSINRMSLSDAQFKAIVEEFSRGAARATGRGSRSAVTKSARQQVSMPSLQQIALNMLSISTRKGLYVLAYKPLFLDVGKRELVAGQVAICSEFEVNDKGVKEIQKIRQYLDNDCAGLLADFESNAEVIKDLLALHRGNLSVDDRPFLMQICFDSIIDLKTEYAGISQLYEEAAGAGPTGAGPAGAGPAGAGPTGGDPAGADPAGADPNVGTTNIRKDPAGGTTNTRKNPVPLPLRAFFGELITRPIRHRELDLVLLGSRIDLDQILAINKALKYPLAYIQGPPGTGKTTTIINTIINAFFHERTVLFASSNNHPIDGVFANLQKIKYRNRSIPFPVVRLGGYEVQSAALDYIKTMWEKASDYSIYETSLSRSKEAEKGKAGQLTKLLALYEERLELLERRDCIEKLLETSANLNFTAELEARQLAEIDKRLADIGPIELDAAVSFLQTDTDALSMFIYYSSVQHLKRLSEPKYKELMDIVYDTSSPKDERVKSFNRYLADTSKLRSFLRVFPVVIDTCISARRLGEPKPSFDMVIIDEASQCNIATALVPIVRGSSLMLVGDPQQLNPVVNLDPAISERLRHNYQVAERYDYCSNSIYKVFLASDSVSDEILLSHHYRSDERIINFNNTKYYHGKLKVKTKPRAAEALYYYNVSLAPSDIRNTAPAEVSAVVDYIKAHPGEEIGVITPFTHQRDLILQALSDSGIVDVACGTVHSFQGDEQDTILFSTGLSAQTSAKTYAWLATNKELINVATSRAKQKLVVLTNKQNLKRLHAGIADSEASDDLYELVEYVATRGKSKVTALAGSSRALGIKPYSTKTEEAFLASLDHALGNIFISGSRFAIHREVPVSQVFNENISLSHLFYTGRFDFVIYERIAPDKEIPVLAIELDGKEHHLEAEVKRRDLEKQSICECHQLTLIRVDNSYARRYNYIKNILIDYFGRR